MNSNEIQWIIDCLPKKLSYPYYKGKYALDLLDFSYPDKTAVAKLKSGRFSKFIAVEPVKKVLANCGNGCFDKQQIGLQWSEDTNHYSLTFDKWGEPEKWRKSGYYQVSRPDENLVLQVNFGNEHDSLFNRFWDENDQWKFNASCHPIHSKHHTMGWVRLDIDMDNDEVLIEEVQSDWIKNLHILIQLRKNPEKDNGYSKWIQSNLKNFDRYVQFMRPILNNWDEALLSAAIYFIYKELGLSKIWYHTNQSGKHFKMMPDYSLPPRSMYSSLPKKFGFQPTKERPELMKSCKYLKKLMRSGKHIDMQLLSIKN